jgi:hypothetical protein
MHGPRTRQLGLADVTTAGAPSRPFTRSRLRRSPRCGVTANTPRDCLRRVTTSTVTVSSWASAGSIVMWRREQH